MDDSIYARVRQRAEERAALAARRLEEEMVWSKGSVLAIKDKKCGFLLVRCDDDIQHADVHSDTTFRATVLKNPKRYLTWLPTDEALTVLPSAIIRPVQLTSESLCPQNVFQWLFDNYPPSEVLSSDEEEGGVDDRPRKRASRARSASKGRLSQATQEGDASNDDEDKPSPKPKKAAKQTKASPSRPPRQARGDSDSDEGEDVGNDTPSPKKKTAKVSSPSTKHVSPQKPKAVQATNKKLRPEEAFPFVANHPALFDLSNELHLTSHKEAMRAVNTGNAELFEKVYSSQSHAPWLFASLAPGEKLVECETPMQRAMRLWSFPIIDKWIGRECKTMMNVFDNSSSMSVQTETAFQSIFDDLVYSHNSERLVPFGTGVAVVNGSLLHKQGSGQARFQTFGRHVRNVAAGRGGRELDNAFTGAMRVALDQKNPWVLFTSLFRDRQMTRAKYTQFSECLQSKFPGDAAQQALVLERMQQQLSGQVGSIVRSGDTAWALELLRKTVASDTSNVTGVFHLAALDETTTKLPESKQMRASLLKKGIEDATPLHYACVNANPTALKLMLKELGDVSTAIVDNQGHDVWHYAVMNPTTSALKSLVEHNVSYTPPPVHVRMSPLHLAARYDCSEHVAVLLESHPEQRLAVLHQFPTRHDLDTPWFTAAAHGSARAMRAMLDSLSNPLSVKNLLKSVRKGTGLTALHVAAQAGHLEVVKLLVERKAQIDARDKHKRTPLLIASKMGFLDILSYLASRGAKVLAADSSGNQAVHYASAFGHWEILDYLIKRCDSVGALNTLVNAETAWKMTPIGLALLGGYSSTCGALLLDLAKTYPVAPPAAHDNEDTAKANGVLININFRDNNYDTLLLRILRSHGDFDIPQVVSSIEYLMAIGADASLADPQGESILHLLARSNACRMQRKVLQFYLFHLKQKRDQIRAIASTAANNDLQQLAAAITGGTPGASSFLPSNLQTHATRMEAHAQHMESQDSGDDDDDAEEETEGSQHHDNNGPQANSFNAAPFSGDAVQQMLTAFNAAPFQLQQQQAAAQCNIDIGNHRWLVTNRLNCSSQSMTTTSKWFQSLLAEIEAVERELSFPDRDVEFVKKISSYQYDLDKVNGSGCTPILCALISGNNPIVDCLLSLGAKTTVLDSDGNNLLHHLFGSQHVTPEALRMVVLQVLPRADVATLIQQLNRDGLSPLHLLLGNLARCSAQSNEGIAEAAIACLKGMLEKGASLSVTVGPRWLPAPKVPEVEPPQPPPRVGWGNNRHWTRAAQPASQGPITNQNPNTQPMCFPVLDPPVFMKRDTLGPEFVVDLSKVPPLPLLPQVAHHFCGGWTALHFAAAFQSTTHPVTGASSPLVAVVDWLLSAVASLSDSRDVFGRTPLMIAVLRNDLPLVAKLVAWGGRLPDSNGVTPEMVACQLPTFEVFTLLVQHNAVNFEASDNWGRTVMHRIAAARNISALHAVKQAHPSVNVNARDRHGVTPLHVALASASGVSFSVLDFEVALIENGADANAVDAHNQNVLHHCFLDVTGQLRGDPIEAIGTMLSYIQAPEQMINAKDTLLGGNTPMLLAVRCKSLSSCLLLASRGAKLDIADNDGNVPLALALKHSAVDLAITLLQLGSARVNPDVDVIHVTWKEEFGLKTKLVSRETACRHAMKLQWSGVVYMLLEAGYSRRQAIMDALAVDLLHLVDALLNKVPRNEWRSTLEGTDSSGKNILHWLCGASSSAANLPLFQKLFQTFIDVGISPTLADGAGNTPAHYVPSANLVMLQILCRAGADINAKNNSNLSPLSKMLSTQNILQPHERDAFVVTLTTLNASPDMLVQRTSEQKVTATTSALLNDDLKTLIVLIERGATLSQTDTHGRTLLMHAVVGNKAEASIILLRSGRDIGLRAQDFDGRTALHHSILANNTLVTQQLVATPGVDVNAADKDLRTPLHVAVLPFGYGSFENTDIIRTLLKAGADTSAKDALGQTPVDYAAPMESSAIRTVFEECGVSAPSMTRVSSVISNQQWVTTHQIVDADSDAAAFVANAEASVLTVAPAEAQRPPVDKVYFKSVPGTSTASVQVWKDYDVTMTKVDVSYGAWGMNMFYRLQVLHDVFRHVWILWTRWGRVGDEGQYQATPFPNDGDAVKEFLSIFKSKSSNDWDHRDSFVKAKGKYLYHPTSKHNATSGGVNQVLRNALQPWTKAELAANKTNLRPEVISILTELCDVTTLVQSYKMTGVQESAWPLGHIAKSFLDQAQALLGQIKDAIQQRDALQQRNRAPRPSSDSASPLTPAQIVAETQTISERIAELANTFYELVPHADFANDRIAPPNSMEDLKTLWDRVASMKDLQLSARLLLAARHALTTYHQNPIDYLFNALEIDLSVPRKLPDHNAVFTVDRDAGEYAALSTFVKRTCQERIHAILSVQRRGEAERFAHFCNSGPQTITNRRLLFHGSGTSNVLPILREGLRIAPPEAPVHGYMFGKGIYFADMASKSMGYAHREGESAFMFVCEVALGKPYHRVEAQYIESLPEGFHSTKALGRTSPSQSGDVVLTNGLVLPLGEVRPVAYTPNDFAQIGLPENSVVRLQSNEYIVYNASQVRLRYIIQFKEEKPASDIQTNKYQRAH